MKISKRLVRIIALVLTSLTILFIVILLIGYSQREKLFNVAMEQAIQKAKHDYNLHINIKKAYFSGLSSIDFEDISAVPKGYDSIANIHHLRIGIKIIPLFFGDIKLSTIILDNGKINLVRKNGIANYDFLFRKKGDNKPSEMNLSGVANQLLNQVLYKIPDKMDIKNFDIRFKDDNTLVDLYTTTATITNQQVKSSIQVNGKQATWHVEGFVYPEKKQLNLALFADGRPVEIPYLEQKLNLKLQFDTVRTQMRRVQRNGDDLEISGSWAISNLLINHPHIASHDILVENVSIDTDTRIGKNFMALDSSSVIHLKHIDAHPFIRYTLRPEKIYEFSLNTPKMNAEQLWDAFPRGLFESLEGMRVAGQLQYHLHLFLDSKQPDQVQFESSLNRNHFKILKWGKTNLQKINNPFIYTPYEYGKPMRDIFIGPTNIHFTPFAEIAPNIKNALLTAEDPSFFSHRGFVEESIRKSIATNFQKKAFKRGGSTISMQLVKNVYLSRQKTLARKIEEMLLVWLIENGRLCTKERMFEVYLNLIEWGPNVYGIGEASHFYFGKQPINLSLGESIFLASIVPRPKSGLYFFEPDGQLRPSLRSYFKLIGGLMAHQGMIPQDSSSTYGFDAVHLKESLRKKISTEDSIPPDHNLEDQGGDDLFQHLLNKRDSIP